MLFLRDSWGPIIEKSISSLSLEVFYFTCMIFFSLFFMCFLLLSFFNFYIPLNNDVDFLLRDSVKYSTKMRELKDIYSIEKK